MDDSTRKRMALEINYEVVTMLGQVVALYSGTFPQGSPVFLALVEAPLAYLRVLHDFCRLKSTTPTKRDVFARQYLDGWTSEGFLDADTVSASNAQLHHLAERRSHGFKWPFGQLLVDCGAEMGRFFDELWEGHPDRFDWFKPSVAAFRQASTDLDLELVPIGS